MFGTLVSTDFDPMTLEFIEDPDPVSAASCSGRRTGCQRCVLMGIECVYPENKRRSKRLHSKTTHQTVTKSNGKSPIRVTYDGAEQRTGNDQVPHAKDFASDDLHDNLCDDSDSDESLLAAGVTHTPMQHSSDGRSSSSRSDNPTSARDLTISESSPYSTGSRSPTVASLGQLPELPKADALLSSLLGSSAMESAVDLDFWKRLDPTHGSDMAWAMDAGKNGATVGSMISEPPSIGPGGGGARTRTESGSCSCLLSSISFLESLASRSASRENRIDLLLADVRNSIETLAILTACETCAARAELNTVRAMAARQVSIICRKLANCYKGICLRGLGGDTSNNNSSHQQKPEHGACSTAGPVDISVSTYRVNRREGLHLLRSLATFQIAQLQQHVNIIKSRYHHQPNQGQAGALIEAENYIKLAQGTISSHFS